VICLERGADGLRMVQLMPLPSVFYVMSSFCLLLHVCIVFWFSFFTTVLSD